MIEEKLYLRPQPPLAPWRAGSRPIPPLGWALRFRDSRRSK